MTAQRQPVNVFYGGAHLFKTGVIQKMGTRALQALDRFGPLEQVLRVDADVVDRVRAKLTNEPVEDYRIDFEDGYGVRSDEEEDEHVVAVSNAVRESADAGLLPPFLGIRIKPLCGPSRERSLKTLRAFLQTVSYKLPANFRVTLPKVERPEEVATLAVELRGRAWIEVLVETPQILGHLKEIQEAAGGKLLSVHLGPYDLMASLGIAAPFQNLRHPSCTHARTLMLMAFADTDVEVVDGPTKILPAGDDRAAVHAAWRQHQDEIIGSFSEGLYQGWDLHPGHLVSRYATVFQFYKDHVPAITARLSNYEQAEEHAVRLQRQFDDASTARGLRTFLQRARDCSAI